MKKIIRSAFAFVLTLVLLISLIPAAFADHVITDPETGAEIVLTDEQYSLYLRRLNAQKQSAAAEHTEAPAPESDTPVFLCEEPQISDSSPWEMYAAQPEETRQETEPEWVSDEAYPDVQDPAPVWEAQITEPSEEPAEEAANDTGDDELIEVKILIAEEAVNPEETEPAEVVEPVDGEPVEVVEIVEDEPAEAAEPVNGEPAEVVEIVDGEPAEVVEPVDGEPVEVVEIVDGEPAEVVEIVDGEPAEAVEIVEDEPAEAAEPVDGEVVGTEPLYTVEFVKDGVTYVLNGGDTVELSALLSSLGLSLEDISNVSSSDSSLFSVSQDENGKWLVTANAKFTSKESLTLETPEGNVVLDVFDDSKIARIVRHGIVQEFESVQKAINASRKGDVIQLMDDVLYGEGFEVGEDKDVTIDFQGFLYKVTNTAVEIAENVRAAVKLNKGSKVTLQNGKLVGDMDAASVDYDTTDTLIESSASNLTIKNMVLKGVGLITTILDLNAGDTVLTGKNVIDAGSPHNTAIDISSQDRATVQVNSDGYIEGSVQVGQRSGAWLRGDTFYNGEIEKTAPGAVIKVVGGEYTQNVYPYLATDNMNYATINNRRGTTYAAGSSVYSAARRSRDYVGRTLVCMSSTYGRSIKLPNGVLAYNETGDGIWINGHYVPMEHYLHTDYCRRCHRPNWRCCCHGNCVPACPYSIVEGANSQWYKGTKDGLEFELSGKTTSVQIDGTAVKCEVDGIMTTIPTEVLEKLEAGNHDVKFCFANGSSLTTKVKVLKDKQIEWTKGSKNGMLFECDAKIKKVLIDGVKVDAKIDAKEQKELSISADILQDLKLGNHTIEFVMADKSHVLNHITVVKA